MNSTFLVFHSCMKDRESKCKFRKARGSPIIQNTMRNKKVEFNSYTYSLSKLPVLAMIYPFLYTFFLVQQGGIQNSHWLIKLRERFHEK